MGKSNLNKFAGGESGENPDFGDMRNPWNVQYSPSGSSGGSAAQVATGDLTGYAGGLDRKITLLELEGDPATRSA